MFPIYPSLGCTLSWPRTKVSASSFTVSAGKGAKSVSSRASRQATVSRPLKG